MNSLLYPLIGLLLLAQSLCAQGAQFGADAILRLNINYLHYKAGVDNQNAVASYQLAVRNCNLQISQTPTASCYPSSIAIETVDDNNATTIFYAIQTAFSTMQSPGKLNLEDAITRTTSPLPPGAAVILNPDGSVNVSMPSTPAQPATPLSLVGAYQYTDQTGKPIFGCVPGDASPEGKTGADSRGAFVKHLIATPFGASCFWTPLVLVQP